MNSQLLRRDQIWFTEKHSDIGNTEIYSLLEYKQRHGANFEKCYLNGKYGAIPYIIENLKVFSDENGQEKQPT
jgi:AAA15 family ATPase/GTPase